MKLSPKKIAVVVIVVMLVLSIGIYESWATMETKNLEPKVMGNGDYVIPFREVEPGADLRYPNVDFVYHNRVYHIVERYLLSDVAPVELEESTSIIERHDIQNQIKHFNETSANYDYTLKFYGVQGYSQEAYLWLVDNAHNTALLLANDGGYAVDSPEALLIDKAGLTNYQTVSFSGGTTGVSVDRTDSDYSEQITVVEAFIDELSVAAFTETSLDRANLSFAKDITFTDENGISCHLVLLSSKEVFLTGFGNTPGICISQKIYDQLMKAFF